MDFALSTLVGCPTNNAPVATAIATAVVGSVVVGDSKRRKLALRSNDTLPKQRCSLPVTPLKFANAKDAHLVLDSSSSSSFAGAMTFVQEYFLGPSRSPSFASSSQMIPSNEKVQTHRHEKNRKDKRLSFLSRMLVASSFDESSDEDDDDETASTVSSATSTEVSLEEDDDDDEECERCGNSNKNNNNKTVSFSTPLVTEMYTRPWTTSEDKYYMYYTDVDYLDFKIGYVTGRDRTRKVSFARDVVTTVTPIPVLNKSTKELLYYSETELQRFLDEFVQSLNQRL